MSSDLTPLPDLLHGQARAGSRAPARVHGQSVRGDPRPGVLLRGLLAVPVGADGTTRERWDYVSALQQADSTDYPIP
ncbi:MAG: hypothetical protein VYA67_23450 [Actinomycetota bacterium]|uniref:Uncharacterized protein n=1 Tax=Mycobacterium lentiflavum TaxID=141349 RepID=A0ABY3UP80_MYCLN|nr:hypothetical protein [Mycobacterium lentiflavum]MEE3066851.1 hypothetical protein [Actinomycetota bacterium]ULP40418.1 hypothetical protein MJO58_15510 [Mycobacterium lentiflavum]